MQEIRKMLPIMLALVALLLPAAGQAQLTCETPPAPFDRPEVLENWQSVWDLMDLCRHQEGVFSEIISGGVGRDGIPPIDNPAFDDLALADTWLQDASPVIALEIDGIARAYPLAILTRHEIANDTLGETPIAVTFCPLCNSAIVFDRRVGDDVLRFGVSGLLRKSDLIMWDDLTQSLWQQLTGEGIVGAHTSTLLDIVPSQLVGYGAFKEQYPHGEVLSTNGRFYGANPYVNYDSSSRPFLFFGEPDGRLFATERVLGVALGDVRAAFPFAALSEARVINETVGDVDVVAIWQPGAFSALDAASIDLSRDVGMAGLFERTIDGRTLRFRADGDAIVDEGTGSTWNIFGTAIAGELAGTQLPSINAFPHFWFAWAAFYPDTELVGHEPATMVLTERKYLDPVLGNPAAPVTLIEFGAYGCSVCKRWHEQGAIDDIIEAFDGEVNFIYRDMPIVLPGYSQTAAEIAQCALDQGQEQFWLMHDALFTVARQGQSSAEDLMEIGAQVGLDADALRSCYLSGIHVETVRFDHQRGEALGIRGTPTFLIGEQPVFNGDPDLLRQLLQAELDKLDS